MVGGGILGTGFQLAVVPAAVRTPLASSRSVRVRAQVQEGEASSVVLNPSIRKDVEKVVDTVVVGEISKPVTAYCRCWRSGTFPLCDGSHMKHNKATGDNVGPLLLKK
ncbi:CDGSH iron-sulfur domain-containing protein NEET [Selaginella moellendorffii]|nr:CDGSH iron-sulfur domain-containing protein NEET-like [Selaginella moellendorffii]XP_024545151.1 CDGSH iron-sulfur domain-containing protein NEET [Selaginella moellendorffii]|eukprot:XP_024527488.1 CDGSH iron-sulfur domain-containing protein NEET-like [Selaginella moellendorffii]